MVVLKPRPSLYFMATYRYDLEFLGDGDTIVMGVSFKSIRHLGVAQVASDNAVLAGDDAGCGKGSPDDDAGRDSRFVTDASWDEEGHCNDDSNKLDARQRGSELPASRDAQKHLFKVNSFL